MVRSKALKDYPLDLLQSSFRLITHSILRRGSRVDTSGTARNCRVHVLWTFSEFTWPGRLVYSTLAPICALEE